MEITVINQMEVWDDTDPENLVLVTPEIKANGFLDNNLNARH